MSKRRRERPSDDQGGAVVSENPDLPQPHRELKRLDRLVGRWSMKGHLVGSDEMNITGETSFRWLPGARPVQVSDERDLALL